MSNINKKLYSLRLERHLLSGLLKFPHRYHEISQFLEGNDFADPSKVNPTIYRVLGLMVNEATAIDPILVSQRLAGLNIKFEDGIDVYNYLQSLSMAQVKEDAILDVAKQIKKLSVRRDFIGIAHELEREMIELDEGASIDDILSAQNKICNKSVDAYYNQTNKPVNIFENMEAEIEAMGENPQDEIGLMLPNMPRLNLMCGSLFRPGNLTVIASRTGVGKSTVAFDFSCRVASHYNIACLGLDNGEMSFDETRNRAIAAISGVPMYMIEKGLWRKNPVTCKAIRDCWKKIKNWKWYYYSVGGMRSDEIINLARRWYYSEVGRGNEMIISYDYIKLEQTGTAEEFWISIGKSLEAMKTFISKEIVFENKAKISIFTSAQNNRLGVSQGKKSSEVNDTEAVIGLSDAIAKLTSHLFILRKKTLDEVAVEGEKFGSHKLIHLKGRHMGDDPARMFDPVRMPDGSYKQNFINLLIDNFRVEERGDLIDWCNSLNINNIQPQKDGIIMTPK